MSADQNDSTTNDSGSEEQIFHAARKIVDSDSRLEYLKKACRGDAKLRARVESLLDAHQGQNAFLKSAVADHSTADFAPNTPGTSQQIGPYKLLHLLGEGGMGSVYLAEQQHPVKRRVAVKLIKQGLNSQQFIARFEAERQALAMMDHPNIAKVLDAGCSDDGRNYFVMEYVKGIPITEFCDENRLSAEERLKLFIKVCQAVQHAHQKGVIHRDLKPSNVMVAMYDDQPVPKVIDFGVAKATHQPLTEHTLCTVPGQIVGTWEYMRPEQAILNQLDVDTRTDIYSLGVVLYELLTGQTPLDLKSLKPEMLEERLRRIREQEPARPSNRVSSLGEAGVATAAYRNTVANSLSKKLRGDLDTIVMKALEKDRSNRYETANGFAAEITRYLNDEPLTVRPPSVWRQLKRLYTQNRAFVTTVALVFFALACGLGLATWSLRTNLTLVDELRKSERQKLQVINELEQTQHLQQQTIQQLNQKNSESLLAKDFLAGVILSASPQYYEERGEQYTVLEMLYELEDRLDELDEYPLVRAYCESALGYAFRTMSEPVRADAHLARAYELYRDNGGIESEESRLAMRRLGWHRRSIEILGELDAIEKRLDPTSQSRASTLHHLAVSHVRANNHEQAIQCGTLANKTRPSFITADLATSYIELGDINNALRVAHKALELRRKPDRTGDDNMETAWAYKAVAISSAWVADYETAISAWENKLRILKLHRHGSAADSAVGFWMQLARQGEAERAREFALQTWDEFNKHLGESPLMGPTLRKQKVELLYGLGSLFQYLDEPAKADEYHTEAGRVEATTADWMTVAQARCESSAFAPDRIRELLDKHGFVEQSNANRHAFLDGLRASIALKEGRLEQAIQMYVKELNTQRLVGLWPRELLIQKLITLAESEAAFTSLEEFFAGELDRIRFADRCNIYLMNVRLYYFQLKIKFGKATEDDFAELHKHIDFFTSGDSTAPDRVKQKVEKQFNEIQREFKWQEIGDLAKQSRSVVIKAIAGGDQLIMESLQRKAAELEQELAGEKPSQLLRVAVQRFVAVWLQLQHADAAAAAADGAQQARFWAQERDRAARRYERALKALMKIRAAEARPELSVVRPEPVGMTGTG